MSEARSQGARMFSVSQAQCTQLVEIILQEQASCQALLDTVEAERRAIKSLAIGDFHSINVRRIAVLEQLQSIADRRDRVVQQIAESLPSSGPLVSMQMLLDRSRGPEVATVRRHHDTLMTVAKRVREEIKQNVVLIEGIRGFVEQALAAGATAMTEGQAYNRSGKPASLHSPSAVLYQQG